MTSPYSELEVSDWTELTECPLCRESEFEPMVRNMSLERPSLQWQICNNCGHVFASPRPSSAWIEEFYLDDYRKMTHPSVKDGKMPIHVVRDEVQRATRLVFTLKRYRGPHQVKRTMDVGSSSGVMIAALGDNFAPAVSLGVEPNEFYREFADTQFAAAHKKEKAGQIPKMKYAVKMVASLADVPKTPKFDIISVIHTLEHLPDPRGLLETLWKSYSLKNCILIAEVPNLFGGRPDPMMFPHIHTFYYHTFAMLFELSGWHVLDRETSGGAMEFHMSPQNQTIVAVKSEWIPNKTNVLTRYNDYRDHVQLVASNIANTTPQYQMG